MPFSHGLMRNPFGESFDHEMVGAQRKKVADDILRMVEKAIVDRVQTLGRLTGTYGDGKTFTLIKLEEKLKDPREFAKVTELKKPRNVAVAFLKSSEARAATNYSLYLYQKIIDDLGLVFFRSLRDKLEMMSKSSRKDVTNILGSLDGEFGKVFIALRDKEMIAWDWLRGQKLKAKELSDLDVRRNIENVTARKYLIELLHLLKLLRYDAMVLLVDEVEYLLHFGDRKAVEMFVAFKEIYDEAELAMKEREMVPIVILLAFAPETWEDINRIKEKLESKGAPGLEPFLARFRPWTVFELQHLTPDDIKDLITVLLSLGKASHSKGSHTPIYPFEEDAVKYVSEKSFGVPRWAMEYANLCLEKADEEKVNITRDNAAKWIRQLTGAMEEETEAVEIEGEVHETEERLE
jgi:hypothetical protein